MGPPPTLFHFWVGESPPPCCISGAPRGLPQRSPPYPPPGLPRSANAPPSARRPPPVAHLSIWEGLVVGMGGIVGGDRGGHQKCNKVGGGLPHPEMKQGGGGPPPGGLRGSHLMQYFILGSPPQELAGLADSYSRQTVIVKSMISRDRGLPRGSYGTLGSTWGHLRKPLGDPSGACGRLWGSLGGLGVALWGDSGALGRPWGSLWGPRGDFEGPWKSWESHGGAWCALRGALGKA